MIREVRRARGRIRFPRGGPTAPTQRTRSIYQGDPLGPQKFNIIADVALVRPFLTLCARNGRGVSIEHDELMALQRAGRAPEVLANTGRLPILVFTDNYVVGEF